MQTSRQKNSDAEPGQVFAECAPPVRPQSPLRKAITAAYRRPEPECLPPLVESARLTPNLKAAVEKVARRLIDALRAKHKGSGVEGLVHEYSLSSQEGVALMCLAEALLRIPDVETRDALIRDKIAEGDWRSHLGGSKSLFVNAATWGLVVTGKLTSTVNDRNLAAALTRLIARAGEPVIRRGVDMAMRMMGEQFVTGETIEEALRRSRPLEDRDIPMTCSARQQRLRPTQSGTTATTKRRSMPLAEHRPAGASTKVLASPSSYRRCTRAILAPSPAAL